MGKKPKFIMLGFAHEGLVARAAEIIEANKDKEVIVVVDSKGGSIGKMRDIENLQAQLERLSETTTAAKDSALRFSEVAYEEVFIPKKNHPKHQKHNKFRNR